MKKLQLFPMMRRAAVYLALIALFLSPFLLMSGEPWWIKIGLCLFLYAAHLLGYALRLETELTGQSAHAAELAALRRKHKADFKTYLEFVKASTQPSKN